MIRFAMDVFAVFGDRLALSGWVLGAEPAVSVALHSPGIPSGQQVLLSYGTIPSPDVAAAHGPAAARVRFAETLGFTASDEALAGARLVVRYGDGRTEAVGGLAEQPPCPAAALIARFAALLRQAPPGELIEIGSRARSGIVRRDLVPTGWGYTGLDVMAGPNVDVVGDAHALGGLFAPGRFQAAMAFSVLEHLLMPWKVVIELNQVLAVGAVGLFTTHQCWPLHEQPWDFWRFSDRAWDALLNPATGFEVLGTAMGEPAYVVAQRCHPVTNFGVQQGGYLASNVLFRKVGPTRLEWPVALSDVVSTQYPGGVVP